MDLVEELLGREDQRVVRKSRVRLGQHLLRALHRTDVVDVRGNLRRNRRVVHVVHVHRRRIDVSAVRDHHVVGPDRSARFRQVVLQVFVVRLKLNDVARPREGRVEIALREHP